MSYNPWTNIKSTNGKRAVYLEDILRSSGWFTVYLRHCAEVPVGEAVGTYPVVRVATDIGCVHRRSPAGRRTATPHVQGVVAALGQGV